MQYHVIQKCLGVSSQFRFFSLHITFSADSRRPPLLKILLVPPPHFHVSRQSLLVPDMMFVRNHTLVGFNHATNDHSGHLHIPGLCENGLMGQNYDEHEKNKG